MLQRNEFPRETPSYIHVVSPGEHTRPLGQPTDVVASRLMKQLALHQIDPLAAARQRLGELATLPEDWDSYGAAPIDAGAVERAEHIMSHVSLQGDSVHPTPEPYFVGPIPDGGIEIEWRHAGQRLDIDVRPDGRFDALRVMGSGPYAERWAESDLSERAVIEVIRSFLAN